MTGGTGSPMPPGRSSELPDPARHQRLTALIGRVPGGGPARLYDPADRRPHGTIQPVQPPRPHRPKVLKDLHAAFDACAIGDGAVLSFHHHLRNGDGVVAAVLDVAAARGLRGLGLATSSIFPVHAPLVRHLQSGVITRIWTDYANGPVAEAITGGALEQPMILQTHGGRARAIETGELRIDVAFIAAPVADRFGGTTGAGGRAACGPLGYPRVDADHARRVVVVTEDVSEHPLDRAEIGAGRVDHVVPVPAIGDPGRIQSGTTHAATDPVGLRIAALAAQSIAASGVMVDGFSFQTGAGGASLAVAREIGRAMAERRVRGGFVSGGITGAHVELVRRGLFDEALSVQSFDAGAVRSFAADAWHRGISAAEYASPLHPDAVVDRLSVMLLGAAEIDRGFNINVTTGGSGRIIGGPGGHPDTAAGAALAVATTRLTGGGYPKVADAVGCITTPGQDVDLLVTEAGIAVNPGRGDLEDRLRAAGLPVVGIDQLIEAAAREATRAPRHPDGAPVAMLEYRDGSIIDAVLGRS